MAIFDIRDRKEYAVVNETTGVLCFITKRTPTIFGRRNTCYHVRKVLAETFPQYEYSVRLLVRLRKKKKEVRHAYL